jgi:hypothetical protein
MRKLDIKVCMASNAHLHMHTRHDLDGRAVCSQNSDDDVDDDDEGK